MKCKKLCSFLASKVSSNDRRRRRDLYVSTLFRSNLAYARQMNADQIHILSAKYGLLELDQVVPPYEMTLNTMSEAEKKAWSSRVLDSLRQKADLKADLFVFLAGVNYRKYLIPAITHYQVPLEGLSFGQQLQELKRRVS